MQNGTSVAFSLIMEMENTNKKCNVAVHYLLLNTSCFQGFSIGCSVFPLTSGEYGEQLESNEVLSHFLLGKVVYGTKDSFVYSINICCALSIP